MLITRRRLFSYLCVPLVVGIEKVKKPKFIDVIPTEGVWAGARLCAEVYEDRILLSTYDGRTLWTFLLNRNRHEMLENQKTTMLVNGWPKSLLLPEEWRKLQASRKSSTSQEITSK